MNWDVGIIIAIAGIGVTMVGVVISMMFWVRQESNALRTDAKEDRKDLMQISRNLELAVSAMQCEMKDFHNKLLEIERKR